MIAVDNIHKFDVETKLTPELIQGIQTLPRSDFFLNIRNIHAVTDALDKRIENENDPKVKLELNGLNEEITQALSYLRGELKSLARANLGPDHPREWAANKIFDELKGNLVKAYIEVNGDNKPESQIEPDEQPADLQVENPINPNDVYTLEPISKRKGNRVPFDNLPYVDSGNLPLDPLATFDDLSQQAVPASIDTNRPDNLDPNVAAKLSALESRIEELHKLLETYTNRPTYNNLLEADDARNANQVVSKVEIKDEPKNDKVDANPKLDKDTQPAPQETSDREQNFKDAIEEVLSKYGMVKLPEDFEVDYEILTTVGSKNGPDGQDGLSTAERKFIELLDATLENRKNATVRHVAKKVDNDSPTTPQRTSQQTTENPNIDFTRPGVTQVSPILNQDQQAASPDLGATMQNQKLIDTRQQRIDSVTEYNKHLERTFNMSLDEIFEKAPSMAKEYNYLVNVGVDKFSTDDFRRRLFELKAELTNLLRPITSDPTVIPGVIPSPLPNQGANIMPVPIS
jgi:hypothetical protein